MFNLKLAIKTALAQRDRSMTDLALDIGKDRAALTVSLYSGKTGIETVNLIAKTLGYELSEFIKLGEIK